MENYVRIHLETYGNYMCILFQDHYVQGLEKMCNNSFKHTYTNWVRPFDLPHTI